MEFPLIGFAKEFYYFFYGLFTNLKSTWRTPKAFQSTKEQCPFCSSKIKELQEVLSMEKTFTFYCLTPAVKGNLLIMPKRHVTRFEELSHEEMIEIQSSMKIIAKAFKDLWLMNDYIILQKNGLLAGQSEAHVHFHVIPCKKYPPYKILKKALHFRRKISNEEMQARVKELKAYFERKN